MRFIWWAAAWLAIILLFLAVDYKPQRDYYGSAGDIKLYQKYAAGLFNHPPQLPQEYPPLTALLFVLPQLLAPHSYMLVFGALSGLATWLVVVLVDRENGQGFLLLLYMLISGFATLLFRFDSFVVLVTVGAFVLAQRHRWAWAQALLALGVGLKLYPALLMPIVALWAWQTDWPHAHRRALLSSMVGGALVVITFGTMWLLARDQLQHMLWYHSTRPLEIESLGATLAWLSGPISSTYTFGSVNITTPLGPAIIKLLTAVNIVTVLLVYALFARRRLGPASAFALVLLFSIVTSKVFSTQYMLWALPFVVLAGERRVLWLLIAVATAIVYPIAFLHFETTIGQSVPNWFSWDVAVRNSLWLIACAVGLWDWCRATASTQLADAPRRLARVV
ncbi:MAG: DUF2029 domain-containing protein [Herpetosiphonaceae bacterium]|nr:DUF2029 domain-containing protein [Herpetosiphonaceae bacterium]